MSNECSEQIFDYLVDEMLNGPEPPDLKERIESAWAEELARAAASKQSPSKRIVAAELAEASEELTAGISSKPRNPASKTVVSPSAATRPSRKRRRRSGPSFLQSMAISLTVAAATAALAFVGWNHFLNPNLGQTGTAQLESDQPSLEQAIVQADEGQNTAPDAGRRSSGLPSPALANNSSSDSDNSSSEPSAAVQDLASKDQEILDSNNRIAAEPGTELDPELSLASGSATDTEPALESVVNKPEQQYGSNRNESSPDERVAALATGEIVERIDREFLDIWQTVGVSPSRPLMPIELADKLLRRLTGTPLGDREVPPNFLVGGRLDTQGVTNRLLQNADFNRYWAEQWTKHWMRGSSWPAESPATQIIENYLSKRLADEDAWNEVVGDLLGGEVAESGLTKSPSNATAAFLSGLSGRSNYRLVNRVGANFLNARVACAQCHDPKLPGLQQLETDLVENARALDTQQGYWNLMALFKELRAEGDGYKEGRRLTDRQAELFANREPRVFYDLPNGELQALDAHLPDDADWRSMNANTPRKAFAKWLVQSTRFDQAVVNQTWRMLLGRPLAPPELTLKEVADGQRQQILRFLAEQFRAHDGDMKQLITWIVSSQPFRQSPVPLARSEWVAANERALQRIQLAEVVFAAGTSLGASSDSNSLGRSLEVAKRWSGSANLTSGDAMLAQPDLTKPRNERDGKSAREQPMPPRSYAIHGERFLPAENEYIQRIAEDERLSWEQKAEHVLLLSEYEHLGNRNRTLVAELREQFGDNEQAALRTLLWAVKNSSAH